MADETPDTTTDAAPEAAAPEAAPAATASGAAGEAGAAARTAETATPKLPSRRRNKPRTPEERATQRRAKAVARRRRRAQEKEGRTPREGTPAAERGTGSPQVRQGTVVSDKADKTITVRIDVARRHRRYEKIVRSSSTLHAHDEANEAHAGDVVRVVESRPLSRTKRWRLVEVMERAK